MTAERNHHFQLIAGLAGLLDRERIIETIETLLEVDAVYDGDAVIFRDIALRFGDDDRVKSVYRTIDGNEPGGGVVMEADALTRR